MKAMVVPGVAGLDGLPSRISALAVRLGRELEQAACAFSVMLTDDAGIRDYNRRFRHVDEPTDVLAFPAAAGDETSSGHYLGDLIISVERAATQADELGHSRDEEIDVLLLHGVLHLLGHDHETDGGVMRELESDLAARLFEGNLRGLTARARNGGGDDAR